MRFSSIDPSRDRAPTLFTIISAVLAVACSGDPSEPATVVTDPLRPPGQGEPPPGGSGGPTFPGDGSPDLAGLIDGEPPPPACRDTFAPAAARPPLIQFVVDTSGSMGNVPGADRAPANGEQSKWQITQQALADAITAMPDEVAVGVTYYPNTLQNGQCYRPEVAAALAPLSSEHRDQILSVNAAMRPFGATPTHSAYAFGVEQLRSAELEGPRFILLITDGVPTLTRECAGNGRTKVDSTPLIADVRADFETAEIRTFVIGSPGSEDARAELSEMALVGGTAAPGCTGAAGQFCHFDMTTEPDFSAALNETLEQITRSTLTCTYAVPTPPGGLRIDYDDVSVVLESGGNSVREFGRSSSADCAAGWQYSADRRSIQLCSSTCDELQGVLRDDPGVEVSVRFGCSTRPR